MIPFDGQFLRRSREARKVDREEYQRLLRANLEGLLYQNQATARAVDFLSADITPEKIKANEEAEKERQERQRLADLHEGTGFTSVQYGLQNHSEKPKK